MLQVLLASDPLWAAVFARSLGGGEGDLGPLGWPGGGLIVAGARLSDRLPDKLVFVWSSDMHA